MDLEDWPADIAYFFEARVGVSHKRLTSTAQHHRTSDVKILKPGRLNNASSNLPQGGLGNILTGFRGVRHMIESKTEKRTSYCLRCGEEDESTLQVLTYPHESATTKWQQSLHKLENTVRSATGSLEGSTDGAPTAASSSCQEISLPGEPSRTSLIVVFGGYWKDASPGNGELLNKNI